MSCAAANQITVVHPTARGFRLTADGSLRGTTLVFALDGTSTLELQSSWGPVTRVHRNGTGLAFKLRGRIAKQLIWGFVLTQSYCGKLRINACHAAIRDQVSHNLTWSLDDASAVIFDPFSTKSPACARRQHSKPARARTTGSIDSVTAPAAPMVEDPDLDSVTAPAAPMVEDPDLDRYEEPGRRAHARGRNRTLLILLRGELHDELFLPEVQSKPRPRSDARVLSAQAAGKSSSGVKQQRVVPAAAAFASVRTFALAVAANHGWKPTLVHADLRAPARHLPAIRRLLQSELRVTAPRVRLETATVAERRRSPAAALWHSLHWCTELNEGRVAGKSAGSWSAVLAIRGELILKLTLWMPPPHAVGRAVWVPFQFAGAPFTTSLGRPAVADAIHFIPRPRMEEFLAQLKANAADGSLHMLCEWIHHVHYFVPSRHDPPPPISELRRQGGWNPLYRIAGRVEGMPSAMSIVSMMKREPDALGRPCT